MNPQRRLLGFCLLIVMPFGLLSCSGDSDSSSDDSTGTEAELTLPEADLTVSFDQTPTTISTLSYAHIAFQNPSAAGFECSYDSDTFAECSSPVWLSWVDEGEHTFRVRAFDTNNSVGETASTTWTVENLFTANHEDLVLTNQSPDAVAPNSWRGILRINCDFSHSSYNDPIVYPGMESAAHLHRFYGNLLIDHNTTMESLLSTGDSSCQGGELNRSAYWVPALLAPLYDPTTSERQLDANGEPAWQVVPAVVGGDEEAHEIFYYSAGIDDLQNIQPVPPGLRMIAGTASTQPGQQQDSAIVRWHCQSWESDDAQNPQFSASIPECEAPDRVRMDIFFPSCWNGIDLDSADHKSHMAYPVNDGGPSGTHCPESHPVAIVRPSYHYAFGVKPEVYDPATNTSRGWRLAADMYEVTEQTPGGLSLHGDWFNGWHPQIMQLMLTNCIQGELDCHDGNLGNGYRLSGTQPGTQFEPEIINGGIGNM